jgi:hypothetical protein
MNRNTNPPPGFDRVSDELCRPSDELIEEMGMIVDDECLTPYALLNRRAWAWRDKMLAILGSE